MIGDGCVGVALGKGVALGRGVWEGTIEFVGVGVKLRPVPPQPARNKPNTNRIVKCLINFFIEPHSFKVVWIVEDS